MILDKFRLDGKIAILTGASGGIGKGMSIALAEAGADMVIVARRMNLLEEVVKEIKKVGRQVLPLCVDVGKKSEVEMMVEKTLERFGKINILVCGAGINRRAPSEDFSEKDWDDVINVNLKGVFLCNQAVGRVMIKQGGGKIINIASTNSVVGSLNAPAYAASKGGVAQLTKSLALDWAKYQIYVNAIGPGWCKTNMTKVDYEDPEWSKLILDHIPLKRWGNPMEDLSGMVVYLASEASNFNTGHVMYVDGGELAY